ncbi:unnamed protein product [Darwinula stevensoni]|uniref:Uncharacterized protein n=1 Tax=Darwinula stevensoni TaxID=69355 RepID=A0A7R9AH22_9CRUS|nr:unnamed protein product [Darwinula stevensoni]CAG0904688.1 unnamed protein product [Darwinula stevensoni]
MIGARAGCSNCEDFSDLGRLQSYERRGNLDIRNYLKVYNEAGKEQPLKDAELEYILQHYPEANTKAYSIPEGYILSRKDFKDLKKEALKGKEDVGMPLEKLSIAMVFHKVKDAFKDLPSLTVADYAFTDTLLKGINQQQKNKFIKMFGVNSEDLESGVHDVFGIAISGQEILGLFFQVKATTSKANIRVITHSLASATKQIKKDFNVFRTGIVLENPSDHDPESPIAKTFKGIFDLYVCAASAVDIPRNPTQLFTRSEEQMKQLNAMFTPLQRVIVMSEAKVTFMCGASGTGKTFLITKRALELAKRGEVLVIMASGKIKTSKEFQQDFNGNTKIRVVDWRQSGTDQNLEALKSFIERIGNGKHVLIDDVPIDLGFSGNPTADALSTHWGCIVDVRNHIESITIAFRLTDQFHPVNSSVLDVKPRGIHMKYLERVRRNSGRITELLHAINEYSRRIFFLREKTLHFEIEERRRGFLPVLFPLPSCYSLHHNKCKDEMKCRALRASHAIKSIYEECPTSSNTMPLFVVVNDTHTKAALVNILASFYSLPLLFLDRGIVLENPSDHDPESPIAKTFKGIFDLYVCAASAVDIPRNPTQLFTRSEEQMKQLNAMFTPLQRVIVMSEAKVTFMCGASGTGKTFLITKRALELAKRGEVLVIMASGKIKTSKEFQQDFNGETTSHI